jgi:hypothetical protein
VQSLEQGVRSARGYDRGKLVASHREIADPAIEIDIDNSPPTNQAADCYDSTTRLQEPCVDNVTAASRFRGCLRLEDRDAERALERAGLTCNKNAIPFDPEKPSVTSGVRLGSSAGTTRGFGEAEFRRVGELILEAIDALAKKGTEGDAEVEQQVLAEVRSLCRRFPIYR